MNFRRTSQELQAFLAPVRPGQIIQAVPGGGLNVPLWILGSSTFGAQLAAHLGLPYAFASHFAPDALMEALAVYRARFQPSAQLDQPYAMIGVNVVAADTDAEARYLFTTLQQAFTNLARGRPGPQQPPIDDIDAVLDAVGKTSGVTHADVLDRRRSRNGAAKACDGWPPPRGRTS